MSRNRRGSSKPQGQPRSRPAAFPGPLTTPAGQPNQSGRPHVTERVVYTVVPVFDGSETRGAPDPAGSPGTYQVLYVLAIPGQAVVYDAVDFAQITAGGDSLLAVGPNVHQLRCDIYDANGNTQLVTVNVNKEHRLRSVELTVQADSFKQAGSIGHDLVAPMLSRWSYQHDVPITTSAELIVEKATQTQRCSLRVVGAVKVFSDTAGASDPDHRVLLSAYRDGISSTEPLWQALSLFRVAEGVQFLRQSRVAAAISTGSTPPTFGERIPEDVTSVGQPNDVALRESLQAHAGRKFTAVLDDVRATLRNAIAHLDPDATILVQDRWEDLQKVEQFLPCLRWIARHLLDSELQQVP